MCLLIGCRNCCLSCNCFVLGITKELYDRWHFTGVIHCSLHVAMMELLLFSMEWFIGGHIVCSFNLSVCMYVRLLFFSDLMQNPLIVPVKILHAHKVAGQLGMN